jgi:hypothetical protein
VIITSSDTNVSESFHGKRKMESQVKGENRKVQWTSGVDEIVVHAVVVDSYRLAINEERSLNY